MRRGRAARELHIFVCVCARCVRVGGGLRRNGWVGWVLEQEFRMLRMVRVAVLFWYCGGWLWYCGGYSPAVVLRWSVCVVVQRWRLLS